MKQGFTIIELLVAISIFIIVTSLVVANFRRGARSDELRIAASGLASALRKAQTMALAGEVIDSMIPSYGVYVTVTVPNRYIIFADKNDNKDYDTNEELPDGINFFPQSIIISQTIPAPPLYIVFEPPKPIIYINTGTSENLATITLKDLISNQTKNVIVNRISGQISIE